MGHSAKCRQILVGHGALFSLLIDVLLRGHPHVSGQGGRGRSIEEEVDQLIGTIIAQRSTNQHEWSGMLLQPSVGRSELELPLTASHIRIDERFESLAYCARDTIAMLEVRRKLRERAAEASDPRANQEEER